MISDTHKEELATKFIFRNEFTADDLEQLHIQELLFLYQSSDRFKEEEGFDEKVLSERMELFRDAVKEKIGLLQRLFVLYDSSTSYPYYDKNDSIEFYTEEEFAHNALAFYNDKQYLRLTIRTFDRNMFSSLFGDIYRLGFKNVIIDKGQFFCTFTVHELFQSPQKETMPLMQPEVMEACIKFFTQLRWKVNYKGKEEFLTTYQETMFQTLKKGKYLIPFKHMEETVNEESMVVHFAKIEDQRSGETYLPLFSDWVELEKVYDSTEYDAVIMNFDDAEELMSQNSCDGMILNSHSLNFPINLNLILAIHNTNV